MKFNQVLIIYKKPSQLRNASDAKGLEYLKETFPKLFKQTLYQQETHLNTIKQVKNILESLNIKYNVIIRNDLFTDISDFKNSTDLLITIGGDGTILSTSHVAEGIPILGVNSLPNFSRGFFCLTTPINFKKHLTEIIQGKRKPINLPLLEASINNKTIPYPALNDVLFTNKSSAETVQYILMVGDKAEQQRGSGIWISAGPGSTAAILSAGGKKMSIFSEKLQFFARELCVAPGKRYLLKKGIISSLKSIKIISETSNGMVYLDGKNPPFALQRGACLNVKISPDKLKIFL